MLSVTQYGAEPRPVDSLASTPIMALAFSSILLQNEYELVAHSRSNQSGLFVTIIFRKHIHTQVRRNNLFQPCRNPALG